VLRAVLVLASVALAGWLGAVQLASSAAYGDLAVRPSLPAALHERAPQLLRAFLGGPAAQTAAAIHNGDLATAERLVAALPPGLGTAIAAYVEAGDVVRAQALIDAVAATDPRAALRDQQRLVAALHDDPNAAEVAGEAWWRLGQIQAAVGYRDAGNRTRYWHDAETSYERALGLGPNEETYLLAAGFQSLANGDVIAARRFYTHAAEVVPNSADAYAGLAWTAAAAGDCAQAREQRARARALYARMAARPLDPLANPQVGAALKRCAR
jgi:tetratricopeptide (TPR) repeat protein